jgi:O-antigen/teichoic acid export membrane protein
MKLIRNIASIGSIQIANYIFPMISIPIISRIIGPDKLGSINFVASYVGYFVLLISFGFDLTAARKLSADPLNEKLRNKVCSEVITSQSILLLVSIFLFTISISLIPQLRAEKTIAVFTFITCFGTVLTQNWLFQAMQDLPKVAILNLISKILFTVTVLLLVRNKQDYIWQPFALSLSQLLVAIVSFTWAKKKYNLKLKFAKFGDCLRLLWNERIFFLSLCIINLYTTTNIVILGMVQSPLEVGYYTAGLKIITIMQMIISVPLSQALFPFVGRAFGESYDKGIETIQRAIPIVFFLSFIICLGIYLGAPLFISIFYGGKFLPSVIVSKILSFIPMIIGLEIILGLNLMMNLKMDKDFFKVTCIGAVCSVVLNVFLVKLLGHNGAAVTWIITETLNLIMFYYIISKKGIKLIVPSYFLDTLNVKHMINLYSGKRNTDI